MSYPWPEYKLPSFAWIKENVSPQILAVKSLHPTQYVLRIDRLQWLHDGHQPEGDDIPHVVTFDGKTWLYDGHHRWMLALLSGETHLRVRNYVIDEDLTGREVEIVDEFGMAIPGTVIGCDHRTTRPDHWAIAVDGGIGSYCRSRDEIRVIS